MVTMMLRGGRRAEPQIDALPAREPSAGDEGLADDSAARVVKRVKRLAPLSLRIFSAHETDGRVIDIFERIRALHGPTAAASDGDG